MPRLPEAKRGLQSTAASAIKSKKQIVEIRDSIKHAAPEVQYDIIIDALLLIHDKWVQYSTPKFFAEERMDNQYMFMPGLLIGWEEIKKDLIFLEPILWELDFVTSNLEEEYWLRVRQFVRENGINKKTLMKSIRKGSDFYYALNEEVSEHLKEHMLTCRRITKQVMRKVRYIS